MHRPCPRSLQIRSRSARKRESASCRARTTREPRTTRAACATAAAGTTAATRAAPAGCAASTRRAAAAARTAATRCAATRDRPSAACRGLARATGDRRHTRITVVGTRARRTYTRHRNARGADAGHGAHRTAAADGCRRAGRRARYSCSRSAACSRRTSVPGAAWSARSGCTRAGAAAGTRAAGRGGVGQRLLLFDRCIAGARARETETQAKIDYVSSLHPHLSFRVVSPRPSPLPRCCSQQLQKRDTPDASKRVRARAPHELRESHKRPRGRMRPYASVCVV